MSLPLGWQTDLAVLRLMGSQITTYDDHLVVRTPDNPHFHWGNLVVVTDPAQVDDAGRWLARFEAEFPDADHRSIGLVTAPDPAPWTALDLTVELDDVLGATVLPDLRPLDPAYTARALAGPDDWEQHVRRDLRVNDRSGEHEPVRHEEFLRRRTASQRALTETGAAAWFGAFSGDRLVADLGIVDCDEGLARYQSVGTDADHRRRGLAGHLLGLAARWSAERGCGRWVIITEPDNPAGRLYRSLGFAPVLGNAQASRTPAVPGQSSAGASTEEL